MKHLNITLHVLLIVATLILPLTRAFKVAVSLTYLNTNGIYEFDPDSPEGIKHAWEERRFLLGNHLPVPAWATPFRERKEKEDTWCQRHIPGWETYPREWKKDVNGNDIGGRYSYKVRNQKRLSEWIENGNTTPWWAVTRGNWNGTYQQGMSKY
jgi:hypothetical protein